jgi:hypothetical protein
MHLLNQKADCYLSLFMPLERQPDKRESNRIRLKNLIKQARAQLTVANYPHPSQLLEPAANLLINGQLQPHASDGLAIFITPNFARHYYLPFSFDELVVSGTSFHVKPLLSLLNDNGRFHILTLSQNHVQLHRANRFTIEPVELADLPDNMADTLWYDDPEKQLQYHVGDGQTAMYHGHNASADKKGVVLRFFRQIDRVVMSHLYAEKTPLILAAVEYLFPLYHEANTYPFLLTEGIPGNPEETNLTDLHQKAWSIAAPHFKQAQDAATAQYQALAETERASADLQEVAPAAFFGRVETLFTPVGEQRWGHFDVKSGRLHLCDKTESGAVDLLNATAVQTLRNGGTVFAVPPHEMPADAPVTAVFRY